MLPIFAIDCRGKNFEHLCIQYFDRYFVFILAGADLSRDPEFKEETSNSVCTQYTSRDCDTY